MRKKVNLNPIEVCKLCIEEDRKLFITETDSVFIKYNPNLGVMVCIGSDNAIPPLDHGIYWLEQE